MSQENVEISLAITEAVNRRDIAYLISHTTEDFVLIPGGSNHIYHLPFAQQYDATVISMDRGECWR